MEAYRIHNDLNLKTWVEIETEYTGDLILNPVQDIIGDVYISIIEFIPSRSRKASHLKNNNKNKMKGTGYAGLQSCLAYRNPINTKPVLTLQH